MVRSLVRDKFFFNNFAETIGSIEGIEGTNTKVEGKCGVLYLTSPDNPPKAYFEGDVVFIKINDEVVFSGVCDSRESPSDVNVPINAFSPRNLLGDLESLDNTRDWVHVILRLQSKE